MPFGKGWNPHSLLDSSWAVNDLPSWYRFWPNLLLAILANSCTVNSQLVTGAKNWKERLKICLFYFLKYSFCLAFTFLSCLFLSVHFSLFFSPCVLRRRTQQVRSFGGNQQCFCPSFCVFLNLIVPLPSYYAIFKKEIWIFMPANQSEPVLLNSICVCLGGRCVQVDEMGVRACFWTAAGTWNVELERVYVIVHAWLCV